MNGIGYSDLYERESTLWDSSDVLDNLDTPFSAKRTIGMSVYFLYNSLVIRAIIRCLLESFVQNRSTFADPFDWDG